MADIAQPAAMTEPLRVGLDVTQAVKRRGRGIARYIRQVVPPLATADIDAVLHIRSHRWFRRALVDDMAPALPRRWMPFDGVRDDLDLFHGFGNHLPRRADMPLSFTVHDVRALDRPAGYEGKARLQRNIARAAGIICLTDYGRGRLLHHHPQLERRCLAVVPHGVDHDAFHPLPPEEAEATAARYGLAPPYLLQLGSWFPHKNLELSVRAFALSRARRDGARLAFVGGGASPPQLERLTGLSRELGVEGEIDWVEDVPGADLPGLLGAARCLLQPSRYEGFALPVLEAMATGLPGVVSDSSCLPEVSAGIWPVAGQDDPAGFADGIDRVALDGEERRAAIHGGIAHAAGFTWVRTAELTARFFRDTLAST